MTFSGPPNAAHGKLGTWPPSNCTQGVNLTVPKTQIRGTGKFFNCKQPIARPSFARSGL